jgi:hypothetical protein
LIEPGWPIQQDNLCDTTMVGTRLWTGQRRGRSAGWSNHPQLTWLSPFKVFSIRSRKEAPVGRGLTFVPGDVETRIRPITGRRSLLPTSQARTSISSPYGSPSLAGEDTGLPRSASEVAWGFGGPSRAVAHPSGEPLPPRCLCLPRESRVEARLEAAA